MYDYKVQRFMAGESIKKWFIVSLKDGEVIKTNAENCMPIGILLEDCVKGDIVEVAVIGCKIYA